jgi:phospholipid N-methyltransferase
MEEFNLSDKIISLNDETNDLFFHIEDVKEFIRLLIEKFEKMEIVSGEVIKYEIKQLAGDKLNGNEFNSIADQGDKLI